MKKYIILTALFFVAEISMAQENPLCHSLRVSYSYMGVEIPAEYLIKDNVTMYSGSTINVDADLWRIDTKTSIGFRLGVGGGSSSQTWYSSEDEMALLVTPTIGIHYGFNVRYHVLYAQNKEKTHWDISLNGSLGSYWCPGITPQMEYGAGVTITYFPFRHIGIFAESEWGRYKFTQFRRSNLGWGNTKTTTGICIRF